LRIVTPKRLRKSKAVNFAAYVVPSQNENKPYQPYQYRTDSQYQQLVDPQTYEDNQKRQNQQQGFRPQQMNMRLVEDADDYDSKASRDAGHKVVCHITNWSFYRKNEGKFVPENLDSSLCTHIIYSFATLDPEALEMREFDPWGDIENQLYSRTVNLDRNVPVLLGMGGWTDSSGDKYSRLVSSAKNRANFISRAISFLRQYGFSGAHIDWNYPSCPQSDCRAGSSNDKEDFSKFVQVDSDR
jgi:chitinase